jgi:predicted permease
MSEEQIIDYLWNPYVGTILFCVALGYVIKVIPVIPNKWIPSIVLFLGSFFFPFVSVLSVPVNSEHKTAHYVMLWGIGLSLSLFAWLAHATVIKRVEGWIASKIPAVDRALNQRRDEP